MNVIRRIIAGREACMARFDMIKTMRSLAESNEDSMNDWNVMSGFHAVVFKYNMCRDRLERVMIEKNTRLAYEWAIHVNERRKAPIYQVAYMFGQKHGFMMTTYHVDTKSMKTYGHNYIDDCRSGHLHWDFDTRHEMERMMYHEAHMVLTGKTDHACNCHVCRIYYENKMNYITKMSTDRNRDVALDICSCKWCCLQNIQ